MKDFEAIFGKCCPLCESRTGVELVDYIEQITIKGRLIVYAASSYECPKCNERFDTKQTLGKNLSSARKAYEAAGNKDEIA